MRRTKFSQGVEEEVRARLKFILGDIARFQRRRESIRVGFAVVFSNAALQWVLESSRNFPTRFRGADPGGRVVVQMPKNDQETAQVAILKLANEPPWNDLLAKVTVPSRAVPGRIGT